MYFRWKQDHSMIGSPGKYKFKTLKMLYLTVESIVLWYSHGIIVNMTRFELLVSFFPRCWKINTAFKFLPKKGDLQEGNFNPQHI
jgi:hypothetical protein